MVAGSPRYSLVVATFGRLEEPRAFLASLVAQMPCAVEVFIIDQNDDDRLVPVVREFSRHLQISHIRSRVRNSSHARNLGLARCSGEIVGFPDDDCVYPAGVLQHVDRCFADDPALTVLSGPAITPAGDLGSGRWSSASGPVTIYNVWTSVIGFNLFVRHAALVQVSGFDESLGVGARYGSSEEPDLVIRLIAAGGKAMYDTQLRVIHPDKRLTPVAAARAFAYGTGMGYVMRKHRVPAALILRFVARPLGGAIINLARARMLASRYYWQTTRGRVSGLLSRPTS
jgi:glycosyltransferase involved in cell wall biosynthesis